jgi:plastocyanin
MRRVGMRFAAASACVLCALAIAGAPALAWSMPVLAHEASSRSIGGGHAKTRSRCAKQERRDVKRTRRCRRSRHVAVKRPLTSAKPAPPTPAAPLTPTALTAALSPAPGAVPSASSSAPSTQPGESVVPTEPPGDTEAEREPPAIPHVQVSAVEYSFSLSRTSVPAGEVVLEFVNDGQDEHNLHLEDGEGPLSESIGSTPSKGVSDLHLQMRPGSYTLFCSLPTHEARGMKATLTVE